MTEDRFPYTTEGYLEAKKWLQETGRWDYVSTHGFSCDGWSIVAAANAANLQIKKDDPQTSK